MYISTVDYYEYFKKFKHRLLYIREGLKDLDIQLSDLIYYGTTLDTFLSRNTKSIIYSDSERHTYLRLLQELNEKPSETLQYFNSFVEYLNENNLLNKIDRLKLRLSKVEFYTKLFYQLLQQYQNLSKSSQNPKDFKDFVKEEMRYYYQLSKEYDKVAQQLSNMRKQHEGTENEKFFDKMENMLTGILQQSLDGYTQFAQANRELDRIKQLMNAFDVSIKLYKYLSGKEKTVETFDIVKMSSYGELKNAVGISKLLLSGDERLKSLTAYKIGNKEVTVRRRKVEEISPYYIIVFDFSGSMTYNDKYVIASSLILAFAMKYKDRIELIAFTTDTVDIQGKDRIIDFLIRNSPWSGGTNYYIGIKKAIERFNELKKKYKDIRLIIVGDLEDAQTYNNVIAVKDELDKFNDVSIIFTSEETIENQFLYNFFKEHYTIYQITDLDTLIKSAKKIVL